MDIFATLKAGIDALRAGNLVVALMNFSEALAVILKGLQPEAVAQALKAPQQSPSKDDEGDDEAVLSRVEEKVAALKTPSGAPAAINWVGILPDILQIIDIIRRRLGR